MFSRVNSYDSQAEKTQHQNGQIHLLIHCRLTDGATEANIGLAAIDTTAGNIPEIIDTEFLTTESALVGSDAVVTDETICNFTDLTMIFLSDLPINCITQGVRYETRLTAFYSLHTSVSCYPCAE